MLLIACQWGIIKYIINFRSFLWHDKMNGWTLATKHPKIDFIVIFKMMQTIASNFLCFCFPFTEKWGSIANIASKKIGGFVIIQWNQIFNKRLVLKNLSNKENLLIHQLDLFFQYWKLVKVTQFWFAH